MSGERAAVSAIVMTAMGDAWSEKAAENNEREEKP